MKWLILLARVASIQVFAATEPKTQTSDTDYLVGICYAWNEFGEGGIVAPTRGEEEMKLEVISEVFGH